MTRGNRAELVRVVAVLLSLSVICGCGVIHYREMTITVRDESTNTPISGMRVRAQTFANVQNEGKIGRRDIPSIQDGITGDDGTWKVTMPTNGDVVITASGDGYPAKSVQFQEGTYDDCRFEIKLSPNPDEP